MHNSVPRSRSQNPVSPDPAQPLDGPSTGRSSVSELGGPLEPECGRRQRRPVCKHRGWAIRPLDLTLKARRKQLKVSEQMRETSFAPGKDWAR